MGSAGWAGDSKNSSISSSDSCSCGWNTSARCFANTAAFFLCRFFAHLSGFDVSKRRGGDVSVGLRKYFIGFQIVNVSTQSGYIIFKCVCPYYFHL